MEDVLEATIILETEEKVPEVDQVNIENSGKRKPGGAKIDRKKRSKDFDNCYKEGSSSDKKTELHKYFEEEKMGRKRDLDILSWWMSEQFRYPIISSLARDVLSIPISTVASESAFSIGGRVLDQYRSSLLPETIQALLCTKDWIFGKSGIEEPGNDIENLTEDVFNLHISSEGSSKIGQSSNTISLDVNED